jgi:glycerol-3-phosphate dehydrogenase subunit B
MVSSKSVIYDLCVVGTGMSGMAAALFAVNRGLTTLQVGCTGEIIFASGLLDLMGVYPAEKKKSWRDPWAGIQAVVRDMPDHPYARIAPEDIRTAFEEFLFFANNAGVSYRRHLRRNSEVITSLGTIKRTYGVPLTMWPGIEALKNRNSCLIVDIRGLKGFSARQIAQTLKQRWPGIRSARIEFPKSEAFSEVYPERLARALESSQNRARLAETLQPHLNDVQIVGLPAILGITKSAEVMSDLERQIGIPVFEIPAMPPSVPGLRLKEAFEQQLPTQGVKLFSQKKVTRIRPAGSAGFVIEIGATEPEHTLRSRGVILATGRFIGQGLHADRTGIKETLLNLQVYQPANRSQWHCKDFLDPSGHPINRAGLEIDDDFRPLDSSGHPAFPALFAAGSILAHQDWMRMKCGSGLAIASAFAAVKAFVKLAG